MNATPETSPLDRLAAHVTRRRLELHMDKVEVARAADITITTYSKIEAGASVRDTTYGKIEPVLGWTAGSCSEILRGGNPGTYSDLPSGVEAFTVRPNDLEDEVRTAVLSASIAVTDLPAPQIRELAARVVEELQRRGVITGSGAGQPVPPGASSGRS